MPDDIHDSAPSATPETARPDLERLIAKLGHELRTPLSAIAMLSEIMRDERLGRLDDPRYRSYAGDIHDSARHAMSVLAGFLDPAADGPQAGSTTAGLPMDFIELDIRALVAGAVSALVPLAERMGVGLGFEPPASLPHLIADRRSLRQILDNLIANALKFTPPGGSVTVTLAYEVGGSIVLGVADTGDGMTAAELERVRAGATPTEPLRRRSGGTGYGLPLVRALAAACGAALEIDSALRQGTRITVTFPHDRVVPV